jgi:hypothetical protein
MHDRNGPSTSSSPDDASYSAEDFGHPRGTLAIVLIYAVVFALSWLGLYVFQFLGRGAPQP